MEAVTVYLAVVARAHAHAQQHIDLGQFSSQQTAAGANFTYGWMREKSKLGLNLVTPSFSSIRSFTAAVSHPAQPIKIVPVIPLLFMQALSGLDPSLLKR